MTQRHDIDGLIVQWGDRLFYPGNRIVPSRPQPRLSPAMTRLRAAWLRERIAATVLRRAPQVMVKVTGGGRNMKAIVAHLRYISKNGRLEMEDELGQVERGKAGMHAIADDWRLGGARVPDDGAPGQGRREAFNIILSMPRGTDPLTVWRAAREFVQVELADHKVVMVLHDHQANPHVHLSVRAESKHGQRLNPRKADLHRWRETFAEKLRGWGVEAEATRQATRGTSRRPDPIWRVKAGERARVGRSHSGETPSRGVRRSHQLAGTAWRELAGALLAAADPRDRDLGAAAQGYAAGFVDDRAREHAGGRQDQAPARMPDEPRR